MAVAINDSGQQASTGNPSSPITFSFTVDATTKKITLSIQTNNNTVAGDQVTGVKYNGVAMTKVTGAALTIDAFGALYMWYLDDPATGANNFEITFNNAGDTGFQLGFDVGEYAGTASGIDSSSTASVASGNSITATTTPSADNCWIVATFEVFAAGTAGADTTIRQQPSPNGVILADSNAAKSPGGTPYSLIVTRGGVPGNLKAIIASFAPAAAAATGHTKFLPLLGVG